ncbi:MAG: methylated-DNA--[protein]-cysteine S-methyltransferase [Leptolyngbyaceae bacterium]|nr:methylated-DNA--[protein]-cysteine S-methyltransferase [Leptolyngbyaceae bacterium]
MQLWIDSLDSPIGTICLVTNEEAILAVDFEDCRDRMMTLLGARFDDISLVPMANPLGVTVKLQRYLDGQLDALEAIAVDPGGTPFQQEVWAALTTIPSGTAISYGELAKKLHKPGASRAVGLANSKNPIAIVIPCHRVIGANGQLTGYAGGVDRKRWLLTHEGAECVTSSMQQMALPL